MARVLESQREHDQLVPVLEPALRVQDDGAGAVLLHVRPAAGPTAQGSPLRLRQDRHRNGLHVHASGFLQGLAEELLAHGHHVELVASLEAREVQVGEADRWHHGPQYQHAIHRLPGEDALRVGHELVDHVQALFGLHLRDHLSVDACGQRRDGQQRLDDPLIRLAQPLAATRDEQGVRILRAHLHELGARRRVALTVHDVLDLLAPFQQEVKVHPHLLRHLEHRPLRQDHELPPGPAPREQAHAEGDLGLPLVVPRFQELVEQEEGLVTPTEDQDVVASDDAAVRLLPPVEPGPHLRHDEA
mmetsp:Transcript_70827/g.185709  ORF Transcript_70827/g.185709 Transcript_70827/m.185709 type:complete len:302 (-) Transcript_70827:619-1524(-)